MRRDTDVIEAGRWIGGVKLAVSYLGWKRGGTMSDSADGRRWS